MKEGMSNNSTASISQARKAVEQLKMEAGMDRVKVNSPSTFLGSVPQKGNSLSGGRGCLFQSSEPAKMQSTVCVRPEGRAKTRLYFRPVVFYGCHTVRVEERGGL